MASLPHPDFANGFTLQRWKSRVRGVPEVLGQFPLACLAEEIATPGEGQLHGPDGLVAGRHPLLLELLHLLLEPPTLLTDQVGGRYPDLVAERASGTLLGPPVTDKLDDP